MTKIWRFCEIFGNLRQPDHLSVFWFSVMFSTLLNLSNPWWLNYKHTIKSRPNDRLCCRRTKYLKRWRDNEFQHWYDFAFRIIEDAVIESSAPHLVRCWNRCRINNMNDWLILNCSNIWENCSNTTLEWHRFQVEWEAENHVISLTLFSLQYFLSVKVLGKQLNLCKKIQKWDSTWW